MSKYNQVRVLSLNADNNMYRVVVSGSMNNKKCDFYINNELIYKDIPYRKGNSIRKLKSGYFINVRDSQGTNRVLRDGKTVFSTKYDIANAYVKTELGEIGREYVENDEYLIVVTRNGKYGLYSSKRKMLLPLKYSTIDIDDDFIIVLGEKINLDLCTDELKAEMLKCMRNGEYMLIGKYSKKDGYIKTSNTWVDKDNNVYIVCNSSECYYWNDGFSEYEIDEDDYEGANVPSDWDDYSYDDSLYDALGGQMDASWNID